MQALGEPVQDSKVLKEFQSACQRMHSAYFMANHGLVLYNEKQKSSNDYNEAGCQSLYDEEGTLLSKLPNGFIEQGLKFDGPISQSIALGILGTMYMSWEAIYRSKIAEELNTNPGLIKSDIIGDMRLIRNIIEHRLHVTDKDIAKLKEIDWLKPGLILLRSSDMAKILARINSMKIRIDQ